MVPLADEIGEMKAQGVSRPLADDIAYYLAVFYRKSGFPNVEVHFDIRGSRIALLIKEGERTHLRHVTFDGSRAFNQSTLFQYMVGGTEERLQSNPIEFPFVQADIENGTARVRGLYESEGYLDVVIDEPAVSYSRDGKEASVTVKIKEGPHYTFDDVVFAGTPVFTRKELLQALGEPVANPYTTQHVSTMQHNLEFYFKEHGYYTAEVAASGDPKKAASGRLGNLRVPVTFTIKAGPVYRFDGVTVTGLTRLRPSVVKNRFRKLTGKAYKPEPLDEHFRELLKTGLFSNLRVNTTAIPGDHVRIDLTAQEAKPKTVGFSLGYGTYDGPIIGVQLGNRNLNGTGRPLTLDIEYSQREERAELIYADPWLLESDVNLRASAFVRQRDEIGYSKRDDGVRTDFTQKFGKTVEFGLFLQAKQVDVSKLKIDPAFTGPTSYQIGTLGITQAFDHRNSPVDPTRGWIITMAEDVDVLGGSVAFGRVTARITEFIPIYRHIVLALGARGGLIYPFSGVPIDERYFNGGATTVRSFSEHNLGPRDPHHYPIGGDEFTVFNAEVDFPIRDALAGAIFADAGNVVSEFKNAGLQEMRFGLGAGLRYKLPIGPIRIDVGANPNPRKYEHWGAVAVSFGFAF